MPTTVSGSYPAVNSDSDATINGLTVGRGGGAVASNTAVGSGALATNSSGTSTAAFGVSALAANTTGGDNAAFNQNALLSNTTGNNNNAFGVASLRSNTTGSNNTGVGSQALFSNTTASFNTAVGYQAGYSHAGSAGFNTFVGYRAGYNYNTSVSDGNNTFVGQQSGFAVTTGLSNTFYGFGSGIDMTTGSGNTIVGRFGGNSGGLDIRTASNYIVLSDGNGNPELIMGGGYNALTNQQIITSNTKGGTVNILSRAQVFPTDNTITSAILLITAVASEGTSGGYTRSDVVFISKRFGNQIAQTNIGSSDGISLSNWTYGFDGSNFRVTQNWGAGGSSLGTRWSILVVSGANAG